MHNDQKNKFLVEFGAYLKNRREKTLKEDNLLQFSYLSNLDNSKLAKIEKGKIDIQFSTLIEIAKAYKLTDKAILGFKFISDE
ncbi:helix-turn-helix domain-containing protein [Arachidicoccus soli]|uniref:XRE family transcriptional regulator n=1 Tax=Arachidicoccus soli TaxID=2341117 RepID=A0A386HLZ4_9BACT|nr:helix-turn-helix transcriptional regulator [Arachidicoccus soli]AYD46384.1 XRE family transcriptional regulator [Arachidicoccus soli]